MHVKESTTPSPTASAMEHLARFGAAPGLDEIDHRHIPDDTDIELGIVCLFDTISSMLTNSQLEDDLEEVLWAFTNVFHRRMTLLNKHHDDNAGELRAMLEAQDGSEVKSVELERLQTKAAKLWDHANAFEAMRDMATQHFAAHTGSSWMPRSGSRISNRGLTASVVDSRSYLMAKRRKETETLCPEGTRIAFSGGDFQDYDAIWKALDATHTKYGDMILLHGGGNGAELIAAKWADARGITQVVFKPDWKSNGRSAPFKRNDKILATVPQGLIATPGTGITENIIDKARKLGIKVMRLG